MYEFSAIVKNDYTIEIKSNTYWNCKAVGNFKLSQYDGSGDTQIDIVIPEDVMIAEGNVYFSYGDERCEYPVVSVMLSNLCYITTNPSYTICDTEDDNEEKVITFFYKEPREIFNASIFCFDGWTVESDGLKYITNNNDVMIISNEEDGEIRIIPNNECEDTDNVIHIKLVKMQS